MHTPSTSLKAPERLGLDFVLFKPLLVSLSEDRKDPQIPELTQVDLSFSGTLVTGKNPYFFFFSFLLPYCPPSGLQIDRECEYRLYRKVECKIIKWSFYNLYILALLKCNQWVSIRGH